MNPGVVEPMLLLLAEDLELQEELLLLEQPSIGRVHGRRRLLRLLVWGDILVIFQLLHLWLGVLGLFVAVLTVAQGLGLQKDKDTHVLRVGMNYGYTARRFCLTSVLESQKYRTAKA